MPGYDVIVIGLGGMGSAAAYHLAARGQRVLGLERFGPAHDQGSSHGGSRIVRQAYFEDPAYVPLLLRAYELWEETAREAGHELLRRTGGLMIGPRGSRTVSGSLRSAEKWGLEHELLDAAELRRRFPTMRPADDDVALYERMAGYVVPETTVAAHLRLAADRGAELRFEEPAISWHAERAGAGVRVLTGRGTYTADRLVVCPGAWAPEMLAELGIPFFVERQVQFWFAPRGPIEPFLPDRHPIYIWENAHGRQCYGFPATGDPTDGIKIAFLRGGEECRPESIDREVRAEEIAEMREFASARIPAFNGPYLRGKPCMFTNTPDEHFVLTVHPEHRQVTVACGFSGHGFKFVPVIGEIIADLSIAGKTDHPIALFNPSRLHAR
jgi:sarcosine oxidase